MAAAQCSVTLTDSGSSLAYKHDTALCGKPSIAEFDGEALKGIPGKEAPS